MIFILPRKQGIPSPLGYARPKVELLTHRSERLVLGVGPRSAPTPEADGRCTRSIPSARALRTD